MVPTPRIRIETSPPGVPEFCTTCTPDIFPAMACITLEVAFLVISSVRTEDTAPVTSFLRMVPYPTTTTSSNASTSSCNTTSIKALPDTFTSVVTYPIYEITRTGCCPVIFSVKLPYKSVMVALLVPFWEILAAITGNPSGPFTIPFTVCCCCATFIIPVSVFVFRSTVTPA